MNRNKLRSIIALNGDNQSTLSEKIGVNVMTLSLKINKKNEFRLDEIKKIIDLYQLSPEDVFDIFFSD